MSTSFEEYRQKMIHRTQEEQKKADNRWGGRIQEILKMVQRTEDEHTRALRAFRRAYPNWDVSPQTRCPQCAQKYPDRRFGLNFCESHQFANDKWLTAGAGIGLMLRMIALRNPQLKRELEAEGIRSSLDNQKLSIAAYRNVLEKDTEMLTEEEQKTLHRLETFAKRHNFELFNVRGSLYDRVRTIVSLNAACPCKTQERPHCPCPQSIQECKEKGECFCRVFLAPDWRERYRAKGII